MALIYPKIQLTHEEAWQLQQTLSLVLSDRDLPLSPRDYLEQIRAKLIKEMKRCRVE